uniref:Major facilitator superfamily (MFS) profile domain-containing protein n=1 Tax=Ciona intestinalis TaxID=7719 RepID=H2Y1E7_CIOIN
SGQTTEQLHPIKTKIYKRRFFMISLTCLGALTSGIQNVVYAGLPSSVKIYFKASPLVYDLLTSLYYFMFAISGVFCIWVIEKVGNRISHIIASIKCLLRLTSTHCNNFFIKKKGICYTNSKIFQVFVLSLPPKIAGTWFDSNQISTATSMTVFSYQAGNGLSLLLPPYIIPVSASDTNLLKTRMLYIFGFIAALAFVSFILIIIFFEEKPPLPPSTSAVVASITEEKPLIDSLKTVLSNSNFVRFIFTFAINYGSFCAIMTVIVSQILKADGSKLTDKTAGQIAATAAFSGITGPIFFGVWLDKTKKFLCTSSFVYGMALVSTAAYTVAVHSSVEWPLWITTIVFGIAFTSYMNIGMEIASELTFPEPASTSTSLIYSLGGVFCLIETEVARAIMDDGHILGSNIFFTMMLLVGFIITLTINGEMKR